MDNRLGLRALHRGDSTALSSPNRCASPPGSSVTLWFTGLPCAGKSTLAAGVALEFERRSRQVEVLDADLVRTTLCKGLGFTKADRDENVARIGWACSTLNRHGVIAVVAAVSPYREARMLLREQIPGFVEIYVATPLDVCIKRDVKGMYKKALAGELSHFTGIDDPYEEPVNPDIVVDTTNTRVEDSVARIVEWLDLRRPIACLYSNLREITAPPEGKSACDNNQTTAPRLCTGHDS